VVITVGCRRTKNRRARVTQQQRRPNINDSPNSRTDQSSLYLSAAVVGVARKKPTNISARRCTYVRYTRSSSHVKNKRTSPRLVTYEYYCAFAPACLNSRVHPTVGRAKLCVCVCAVCMHYRIASCRSPASRFTPLRGNQCAQNVSASTKRIEYRLCPNSLRNNYGVERRRFHCV